MFRKCRYRQEPIIMARRDRPIATVRHELMIQQRVKRFEEDYGVVRKLGEGSFGLVYEVLHKQLGLRRALKIIKNTTTNIFSTREEINLLSQLDHPNIIKLYQYYEIKDNFYLITELSEGKELIGELIQESFFCEPKVISISLQVLKALHYTHKKKIAHRDLKAQNLLVNKADGKWIIKVIDWGLGAIVGRQSLQRKCGTPEYAAPEIFLGDYNEKCDMWSLGVLIYIMIIGEHPFRGENFAQTMHKVINQEPIYDDKKWSYVSPIAQDLVRRLLTKDPYKRLSAEQTINHEWFKVNSLSRTLPVDLGLSLQNLREFNAESTLRLAAWNYINNCLATQQERRKLSEIFKYLDKDNDGFLSFNELVQGYSCLLEHSVAEKLVEEIFDKIDMNKSGKLQYNQFVTFAMITSKMTQEDKLKEAFQMFDRNGDGRISATEVKEILFSNMQEMDEEAVLKAMSEMDINGDGFIDENEFVQCLAKISREVDMKQNTPILSYLDDSDTPFVFSKPTLSNTPTAQCESTFKVYSNQLSDRNFLSSEESKIDTAVNSSRQSKKTTEMETEDSESQPKVSHIRHREVKAVAAELPKRTMPRSHNIKTRRT